MKTVSLAGSLVAVVGLCMGAASLRSGTVGNKRTPVLLELFTSEGCSSCPPADRLLQVLDASQPIEQAELIVLSEHVDYWNHDGWTDPYSSAAFSKRQQEYAKELGKDDVYTPQLIVDGAAEVVGSNEVGVRAAITRAAQSEKEPMELSGVLREGGRIRLHLEMSEAGARRKAVALWVAIADEEDRSQVGRGENAGRSLSHVAVVRTLKAVGTLRGGSFSKDLVIPEVQAGQGKLRVVAFAQEQVSGRVIAVTQQKL